MTLISPVCADEWLKLEASEAFSSLIFLSYLAIVLISIHSLDLAYSFLHHLLSDHI